MKRQRAFWFWTAVAWWSLLVVGVASVRGEIVPARLAAYACVGAYVLAERAARR